LLLERNRETFIAHILWGYAPVRNAPVIDNLMHFIFVDSFRMNWHSLLCLTGAERKKFPTTKTFVLCAS